MKINYKYLGLTRIPANSQSRKLLKFAIRCHQYLGLIPSFAYFCILAPISIVVSPCAYAAPKIWAPGTTDFNLTTNWTGGLPGSGDIATFTGAAGTQPNVTANITVSGLNFSTAASSGYNLTSSGSTIKLTLNSVVSPGGSQAIQSLITSGTNTITAPLVLNGSSGSTQTFLQSNGGTLTLNGVISSTNSITLSLSSTGTFNLNGANTYSGTTAFVNTGSVIGIGDKAAFGTSRISFVGNAFKANVDLTGSNKLVNAITLGGSPTFQNSGAFGLEFSGNVDMDASNRTITSAISGGLTFDGIISNGNTLTFTTQNLSVVTLTNASNSFTGFTTSGTGRVSVSTIGNAGANGNLGTGTINLGSGSAAGVLVYTGGGETTSKVINLNGSTGGATIDQSGSGLLKFSGSNTATGNGIKTLTLQGSTAGTGEISGAIVDNSGTNKTSVVKAGTGTWTISGANTYTGTTAVNGGTLLVNGNSSSATGNVSVSNMGSVLGGSGTIGGAVTVNANATILGGTGNAASGTLTLSGALTLSSGSIVELALGSGGTHSTLARTSGSWTFNSTQAFTFLDFGAAAGIYNNIITGLAADPGTEGAWTVTNAGWVWAFSYDGGLGPGNIDLTLTAVPEPGTWAAGILTVLALGWTGRTRLLKRGKQNVKCGTAVS